MESTPIELPDAVSDLLADQRQRLRSREISLVRIDPLLLETSIDRLVHRRRRLYYYVRYEAVPSGYEVFYRRRLKRTAKHPDGRECTGTFHIANVARALVFVVSTLTGDDHRHGPKRFVSRAYPLAKRPFFPSTVLVRLINSYADQRQTTPITLDTWGYHRQTRKLRRDLEHQSPDSAMREMAEQKRRVHRLVVSFRRQETELAQISFDRNAQITVRKGNPSIAARLLLVPGIQEAIRHSETYQVARACLPSSQEAVTLTFADDQFSSYDTMHSLCDSIRQSSGLNVTIIHLNPYLQAQVLDFFTGIAVDLFVTDLRTVVLVPRSETSATTMERIAGSIFRYFGEAKIERSALATIE